MKCRYCGAPFPSRGIAEWPHRCICGTSYESLDDIGTRAIVPEAQQGFTGLPGSALAHLIKKKGFEYTEGCGCEDIANLMNANGVLWCQQQREFVVDHMVQKAHERGWLLRWAPDGLIRPAANRLFDKAMRLASGEAEDDLGD